MRKLRAVVVGTGFIGPVHVEALRRAGVEAAGIVGSTPEKSREAAQRLGIDSPIATLDDALADPTIDAVHLATPNRFHFAQTAAVLAAGKHVVCEKPLAMTTRESAELVRLAGEAQVAAAVAYNIRFYPLCVEAAERFQSGECGDLLHVHGSYVQDWLLRSTDFNWRVLAQEGGELRAVADIGTHWLDLVQFITGRSIVAVCADLRTVHDVRHAPLGGRQTFKSADGETTSRSDHDGDDRSRAIAIDTEDCGSVLLRFADGANGCLWVSQTTAGRKNCLRFELSGARKSLAWNSESPNELWIGHRDRANELLVRDPTLMQPAAAHYAQHPGGHNEGYPDSFKQLFRAFYGYIRAGDFAAPPPFPSFADGHRELLLCEAILQSHRERRWVEA
ncbi:MAG: Gfo/Idh/MocA family oxidoreductase [Pirellulales bacterium]